jgi:hypothetical protein
MGVGQVRPADFAHAIGKKSQRTLRRDARIELAQRYRQRRCADSTERLARPLAGARVQRSKSERGM